MQKRFNWKRLLKKYMIVDETREMKMSGDAEEFKLKDIAEEKILPSKVLNLVRRQS